MELTGQPAGRFCWIELATTDTAAAVAFYTALFGWTTREFPLGEAGTYAMLDHRGLEIGGLYALDAKQAEQGVPPHWLPYVAVASADDAAGRAPALGGTDVTGPFDVMTFGRMAVLQDPVGASFAVWQAKDHPGMKVAFEPGAPCWFELATTDPDKAAAFYTRLFGWGTKSQPHGEGLTYTEWLQGDQSVGGMFPMIGDQWQGIPPHWMTYFAVDSCEAAAGRAGELGGSVVVPPTDVPDVGRFAIVRDPQGAAFAVIRLTT